MMHTPTIAGVTDPRFAAVQDAFASSFSDGLELGAAVAVVLDGQPVVDLWGGTADASGRPWTRDTLVNVWSVTKAISALALAMLQDRGQLDMTRPVADYWPDFAANGKGQITMDQALSHQAGLDGLAGEMALSDALDHTTFAAAVARMAPLWQPGSACVYHSITLGALMAEPFRQIDGRSIGRFIADEIAGPLNIDFFLGLPLDQDHRVAELVEGRGALDWQAFLRSCPYPHSALYPEVPATAPNSRAWRAAEVAGAGGQSDAISLAKLFGGLANGTSPVISPAGLSRALQPRFDGPDGCSLEPVCFAAGFRLRDPAYGARASRHSFGHCGWGGSVAFADPDAGLGFAFVTRNMLGFADGPDPRRARLLNAVYDAL